MGTLVTALLLLAVTSFNFAQASAPKSKFLVAAPRRLLAGQHEKIWVSFADDESASKNSITINLLHPDEPNNILSKVNVKHSEKSMKSVLLEIPLTDLRSAQLEVVVDDGVQAESFKAEVLIDRSEALTFIETDKPFYKPGELVRMRFLLLQHKLLPYTGGINKIWIESPSEVRMAQWLNVETSFGMAQLELQLSEEPLEGLWKIKLQANNISNIITKTFEVKEYVLPKFEVIITPPEYITLASTDLSWNVCAKYSYGKPVQGNVKLNFTFETPYFHWYGHQNDESKHIINQTKQLHHKDGCQKFHLSSEVLSPLFEKHAMNIHVTAVVEEAGTGESQQGTHTAPIHTNDLSWDFTGSPQYFRPYLPYHGVVRVTQNNGKPVEGEEVTLSIKLKKTNHAPWTSIWNLPKFDSKNFTSDANGFIHFIIPPQTKEVNALIIEVLSKAHKNYNSFEAKQWYSPTDSYIQVVDYNDLPVKCDSMQSLDILYTYSKNTTKNIKFYYLIHSKGDLLKHSTVNEVVREAKLRHEIRNNNITLGKLPSQDKLLPVGKWHLKLNISATMAPTSQIIVYYIREDGEAVAASYKLNIRECLQHKVSSSFLHDQVQPGSKVFLSVTPSSRSLCAITGVDKAVTFLAGDSALTQATVFQQLKRFDIGPAPPDFNSHDSCVRDAAAPPIDMLPVPMPLVAKRSRRSSNLYTQFGNGHHGRSKRYIMHPYFTEYGNTKRAFSDAGMVILSNLLINPTPCSDFVLEGRVPCNPCPLSNKKFMRGRNPEPATVQARGMVFQDMMVASVAEGIEYNQVMETPAVEMRTFFPETWIWNLEIFNDSQERTFELETPHSITDWIVNTVCVSATDGLGIAPSTSIRVFKPYFMDFTLPYSVKRGEILPLKVSLFNYLNHALPIQLNFGKYTGGVLLSSESYSACLGEHKSLVHEFRLNSTLLGEHNISVTANVDADFPSPCGPETIMNARDGLTKKIIVKPEGFPEEITNSIFVCLTDEGEQASLNWDLHVPENVVTDSARAFVSVIGDIMGPSLENLDSLVQLPMGCGEQNMILFVPNIVVLNYLNSSGQSNAQLQSNALSNMKKGYQRELTYRHKDGSYSAFGQSDPEGSMWLTAFVVKSFAQARKHIFVDENDLKLSVAWITRKQLENGCFPFFGTVFHKDMKGGLSGDSSNTALTAYVLISLLETGLELDRRVISNGVYCLLGEKKPDLYTLTLTTYALTLISEKQENPELRNKAEEYMSRLLDLASTDKKNEMWWEKKGSKSLGLSVEMTGYAILSLANLGSEENLLLALNSVRWISKQRNANGGFVSTQDTVVALEALARYAMTVPSQNVSMQLLATTSEEWSHEFLLTHEDRLVLQQKTLPKVPSTLTFLAKGKGCALFQSNLRYNVKNAPLSEAFNLSTSLTAVVMKICSQLLFEANMAYNLPDGASNMAVLEVELLSGYIPVKDSLDQLMTDTVVNLKRWDESNGKVNLYFDSVTNKELSLNFLLEQAVEVESPQAAQVKLYDYYEQENVVSTSYGLEDIVCEKEKLPEPVPDVLIPKPADESSVGVVESVRSEQVAVVSSESEFSDEPAKKAKPRDPFENFSNVDHELAVPDGMEGVEPVFVPAPPVAGQHIHIRDVSESSLLVANSCPVCFDEPPTGFAQMYCSSASVLKLSVRSAKSAKLLNDISPSKRPSKVNKNVSLVVDKSCSCDILTKEGSQVIVMLPSKGSSSFTASEKPTINLDQGVKVVRITSSRGTPNIINQARKRC